jgi:pyruvate carboxylase
VLQTILGAKRGARAVRAVRERGTATTEKADAGNPQHMAVPFAGVVRALVAEGDTVEAGQAVATIEAMKMEASITTPSAGTVSRLAITDSGQAEGGDLLLVLG